MSAVFEKCFLAFGDIFAHLFTGGESVPNMDGWMKSFLLQG